MTDPERTLAQVPEADRIAAAAALAAAEGVARDLRHEVNVAGAKVCPLAGFEVAAWLDRIGRHLDEAREALT